MNDLTPTREQRTAALEGMGCKRKRVEDIRFTQGKGNYVDDLKLPGMLHGDFVRSPHAHARVKSINSEEALKVPGVLAVITAETLKNVNLAWMPTLAGDVQMVLADGKVLYQNQEVAFVVATDRYAADDGVNKVVVEYEPLPVIIDPFKAMAPDAPVLREDLAGKTSGAHGPRKHHNHIFEWSVGDKELTAGELRTRGYYLGSNVSYNLKKLVEMGFLDHQRSRVDRRSVRIKLTQKGREVRQIVSALYDKHVRTVEQVGGINADEFSVLNKALHRLERFWTDQILYRL